MNKAMIIGYLGKDPELRYTNTGTAVVNFSVATSETWTDKQTGNKMKKTEWHQIVAWRKLAEICNEYLTKGRQVYVEGQLQTRSWEKDGIRRYTTEIHATSVEFLGNRQENSNKDQVSEYCPPVNQEDDIPF